jgi:hypothetical protein
MVPNTKEHRKCLFEDIQALYRDIRTELSGLMDKESTAVQRRAIMKTARLTVKFEEEVIDKLIKKMELD